MPVPVPPPTRQPVRKALSIACQYTKLKDLGLELHGTHYDPLVVRELLIGMSRAELEAFYECC